MFTGDVGDLLVPGPVGATQRPAVCTAGGPVCTVNVTALGMHSGQGVAVALDLYVFPFA